MLKKFNLYLGIISLLVAGCSIPHKDTSIERHSRQIRNRQAEESAKEFKIYKGRMQKITLSKKGKLYSKILICNKRRIPIKVLTDNSSHGTFSAVIPVSYYAKNKTMLCYNESDPKKEVLAKITIQSLRYPKERLHVDKKRVHLSQSDLRRVLNEKKILKSLYNASSQDYIFNTPFEWPLSSKITSHYGTQRVFNNNKHTVHLGNDLRAGEGSPIYSANKGKVVFAGDLFFTGKTIIIDHGLGIFTTYGHMSKLAVKVGDIVSKKARIGSAGSTGRVTGPHLHWGVKIHGEWIDGLSLVKDFFIDDKKEN